VAEVRVWVIEPVSRAASWVAVPVLSPPSGRLAPQNSERARICGPFRSSGGGIRTRDLRVMSPTSYLTAPPRGAALSLAIDRCASSPSDGGSHGVACTVRAIVASERIAVVDLGTNSTRLLVADVSDDTVNELERRTNVTRLGQGVDASGRLADDAIERVLRVLSDYRKLIDDHGAGRIVAVATSAVRDAENGAEFRELLRERFGIEAEAIPGEEEARLTFLGATGGRSEEETLVIDIGGGSTEYVIGLPGDDPGFHVSTRMGSVRHSERYLQDDPPSEAEVAELRGGAREIVEDEVPAELRERVVHGIAVAGTATSLAAIDQELDPYDPDRVHGYELSLEACERMLKMLAALPLAQRREVAGLNPDRAPTIVAGAAILLESMKAFGLERMEISEADILHGAALDASGEAPGPRGGDGA
jgi:exopolyphosphatase/guanosine-5'-triphosphate,3'-diphosphate pyrophosphatase